MHALRLGETNCATHESFDPRPQIEVFALDFLRVLLAHLMLLGVEMPLVGALAIRGKPSDAKRCQQLLQLQEDVVLAPSEHIGQDLARVMINGVPQPTRLRFLRDIQPHLDEL